MRSIPAERSGCFRASIEGSCNKLRQVTHLLPALFVLFHVMGFYHDLIAVEIAPEKGVSGAYLS